MFIEKAVTEVHRETQWTLLVYARVKGKDGHFLGAGGVQTEFMESS